MAIKKEAWLANDGTFFATQPEAANHEAAIEETKALERFKAHLYKFFKAEGEQFIPRLFEPTVKIGQMLYASGFTVAANYSPPIEEAAPRNIPAIKPHRFLQDIPVEYSIDEDKGRIKP